MNDLEPSDQIQPAGHPQQVPRDRHAKPAATAQARSAADDAAASLPQAPGGRANDTMLGRPTPLPRPRGHDDAGDVDDRKILDEVAPEEMFASRRIPVPGFWLETTFLTAVLLLAGIVGLVAYSQALSVMSDLARLSRPLRIGGYVVLGALLLAVAAGIAKFAVVYLRLRRGRQIALRQVRMLSETSPLREKAFRAARNYITEYVRSFRLTIPEKGRSALEKAGLARENIERLQAAQARLLRDRSVASREWLREFEVDFQAVLDAAARERISRYALRVGIKTAISPYALLDMLAAIYNNFLLFSDLARIYNKRLGRLETIYLLAWVLINTYVAGELQEPAEEAMEHVTEKIIAGCPAVVKKLGGKLTEGTANYILTLRLGRKSMSLLRPLQT